MKHLADTSVLILGLGHSGLAMARWCARFGARIAAWDSRLGERRRAAGRRALLADELPQVRLLAGALDAAMLDGVAAGAEEPGPVAARRRASRRCSRRHAPPAFRCTANSS